MTYSARHRDHTTFPPIPAGTYQPHRSLIASMRSSPRPCSESSAISNRLGGFELASHTRMRAFALSDSSHIRTIGGGVVDRDAWTALVKSSETNSSALSLSPVSPHSHRTCLACSRAQDTAPGNAPSSRQVCSGHRSGMLTTWRSWQAGTGGGILLRKCERTVGPASAPSGSPTHRIAWTATDGARTRASALVEDMRRRLDLRRLEWSHRLCYPCHPGCERTITCQHHTERADHG